MSKKKLFTELRSFAETTSVLGISRVMKAKTRVTFFTYLFGVLTCAALLVWQLSVVLKRYFQYPVSTLTGQAPAWQNSTFPDITVCNLDPMVYDTLISGFGKADMIASINNSLSYTMIHSPITDVAYYYDWFWRESYLEKKLISAAWDSTYYKCFTLRPPDSDSLASIRGFSAIMYVDQFNGKFINESIKTYPGVSVATGLSILVHAAGTQPDMTLGVNLSPGTTTNIELTQSVRKRLGHPYTNCTKQQHLPWDNASDAYTQRYCANTCVQQYIVKECGCVSVVLVHYTMAQLHEADFQICENLQQIENNSVTNSSQANEDCADAILYSDIPENCSAACLLPCSEFQYDAAVNVVPWPRSDFLRSLSYEILKSDPRFLKLFNISANATVEEIYAATSTPTAIDVFKTRFLELTVQFGDQLFVELKDVAAFSVDEMGAQIGGVLSLWLGVTIMFVFEAFEFLYLYLTSYCCKKEPTQTDPTSTAPSAETELSQSVVGQMEGTERMKTENEVVCSYH